MTHVVTEACIKCRYADCVAACPVECFHEGPNFMCIDPRSCIDCGVCVSVCPVDAIRQADSLAEHERVFLTINAELAQSWPVASHPIEALPEASAWRASTGKLPFLER
ncbi:MULTISPECIES: ferredoxin family protein [Pandoraea]|uniref:Ferredoxin n=1 Tax=Pandoraea communis TaxID=2508297 RepID=A0A5E4R7K2_9BURK|nr:MULTISPECIES: ferredoxin family protein [Pandoraea]EON13819.1 4Fe-4S ferredoxin iron-sulfur-binding domain-containing protein [Pandoraea sp. SD6-2]VVD59316.1 4Fe-4S ferredoxin iron-sulfur-binding domain-containing protein [Pandoraea communis]